MNYKYVTAAAIAANVYFYFFYLQYFGNLLGTCKCLHTVEDKERICKCKNSRWKYVHLYMSIRLTFISTGQVYIQVVFVYV